MWSILDQPTDHTRTHTQTHIMLTASNIRILLATAITLATASGVRLAAAQTQQGMYMRVFAVRIAGLVSGCFRPRTRPHATPFGLHSLATGSILKAASLTPHSRHTRRRPHRLRQSAGRRCGARVHRVHFECNVSSGPRGTAHVHRKESGQVQGEFGFGSDWYAQPNYTHCRTRIRVIRESRLRARAHACVRSQHVCLTVDRNGRHTCSCPRTARRPDGIYTTIERFKYNTCVVRHTHMPPSRSAGCGLPIRPCWRCRDALSRTTHG